MHKLLNLSARITPIATIAPQQAGVGTIRTPWLDMQNVFTVMAVLALGALGAGATVDALFEQATDAAGTNAKAVPGGAIAQLLAAGGGNRQAVIDLRQEDLDRNAGFRFVRLSVTVGGAASQLAAMVFGADFRAGSATANAAASVAQIV